MDEHLRTFASRLRLGRVRVSEEAIRAQEERAIKELTNYQDAEKSTGGPSINYKVLRASASCAPVTRRKSAAVAAPSRYVYRDDIEAAPEDSDDLSDWEELERARKRAAADSVEQKAQRALRKLAREARRDQQRGGGGGGGGGGGSDDEWGGVSSRGRGEKSKRPMRRPRRQRPHKATTSSKAPRRRAQQPAHIVPDLEDGDFDINANITQPLSWRQFLPTAWITSVHPGTTSYFPQLYDTVVYFRQGHQEYVETVKKKKLHALSTKKLPWMKFPGLRGAEVCTLDSLGFAIGPPSVCVQKLRFAGNPHGKDGIPPEKDVISLRYRDTDELPDFVIMKDRYDTAMAAKWDIGDRFRMPINDENGEPVYYPGTIIAKQPLDLQFPLSPWRSLTVKWDAEDAPDETTSPWELEKIPEMPETVITIPASTTTGTLKVCPTLPPGPGELDSKPSVGSAASIKVVLSTDQSLPVRMTLPAPSTPSSTSAVAAVDAAGHMPAFTGTGVVQAASATATSGVSATRVDAPDSAFGSSAMDTAGDVHTSASAAAMGSQAGPADQSDSSTSEKMAPVEGEEQERIIAALNAMSRVRFARLFRHPVDFKKYKDYCESVAYPIDMQTIRLRVKNKFYRRKAALVWDLSKLRENAETYNRTAEDIVHNASIVHQVLMSAIYDRRCSDVMKHPLLCEHIEATGLSTKLDLPSSSDDEAREDYIAAENETPRMIAKKLGVPMDVLVWLNGGRFPGLKPNSKLQAKTTLIIPSMDDIERGVPSEDEEAESEDEATEDEDASEENLQVYSAEDDETLKLIGVKFGIAAERLLELNKPRINGLRTINQKMEEGTSILIPMDDDEGEDERADADEGEATTELEEEDAASRSSRSSRQTKRKQPAGDRPAREPRRASKKAKSSVTAQYLDDDEFDDDEGDAGAAGDDAGTLVAAPPTWEAQALLGHQDLMQMDGSAEWFNEPVDTRALPDYLDVIKQPMDFGTIRSKLVRRRYASFDAYCREVELVFDNAKEYNEGNQNVIQAVDSLAKSFGKRAKEVANADLPSSVLFKMKKLNSKFVKALQDMHRVLLSQPEAAAFSQPVDASLTEYFEVIQRPMDLGTIRGRLGNWTEQYRTLDDYVTDVLQVFTNAKIYNEPQSVYYMDALALEQHFVRDLCMLTAFDHKREAIVPNTGHIYIAGEEADNKLARRITSLHSTFMNTEACGPFLEPVPPGVPQYFDLIIQPMDLVSVQTKRAAANVPGVLCVLLQAVRRCVLTGCRCVCVCVCGGV